MRPLFILWLEDNHPEVFESHQCYDFVKQQFYSEFLQSLPQ